jgi:cell division protease FtsH
VPERAVQNGGPRAAARQRLPRLARHLLVTVVALVLAILLLPDPYGASSAPEITYSDFVALVDGGAVRRVTMRGMDVHGVLVDERTLVSTGGDTLAARELTSVVPPGASELLTSRLLERGVQLEVRPEGGVRWFDFLLFLPLLLLLGLYFLSLFKMRGGAAGMFSFSRSGAHLYDSGREKTTFDDVAGADGAKQELREIIQFLKDPERFRRLGAEIPRGVLLVGPPGTGKTLLARAVAGEAGVPFFSITGSAFVEMFVGVGPKRVRDLFESAKATAPSIVFIDELDAVGGRRGAATFTGSADERERTLNQLLSEMSGFEPAANVIVMAATNRPDVLDPALLRPGRFDRCVAVELPATEDREKILRVHARNKPLAQDVDLPAVARATPGFSGADLKNLLNEAAILAARNEDEQITQSHIEQARDKVMLGLEREGVALTERELGLLASHEAGHAVLAAVLPGADPLHKVTIVPRGRSMGATQQLPTADRYIYERGYMLDRITVMMGGRAAEKLVHDTLTSGAEDDLRQATQLARRMVLDWGMSEALGPMVAERSTQQRYLEIPSLEPGGFSEETERKVDEAVRSILEGAYERALSILEERRAALERVAARLRQVEVLEGKEVAALVAEPAKADPRLAKFAS